VLQSMCGYSISSRPAIQEAAEKADYFVIPSEARNLSSIDSDEKKERFLASLGMTLGCLGLNFVGGEKSKADRMKFVGLAEVNSR
jgi:hypothetical protein